MRKRAATTLALATLLALVLTGYAATSRAQDAQRSVNLSPGCNMVALSFASGTQAASVAAAVSPSDALDAVWRLDNASRSFQAFMPQAPQASDLTSVNLLDAVFMCVDSAAAVAMPSVSPDAAGAPISVNLSTGCNAVGLSFADGTNPSELSDAVTPAGALQSIWRLDNATHAFQAYVAAAPQASDLTSLQFLDAAFVCAAEPATLSMPAVTQPAGGAIQPPPTPSAGGEEAVRYVMEGAVPQAVDLPQGFVAMDESFESFDPPGLLHSYSIVYADPMAVLVGPPGNPSVALFDLALFDTAEHAHSVMVDIESLSPEEMQAELWSQIGGATELQPDSLTIEEVEPAAGVGDEAVFIRARVYERPAGGSGEFYIPRTMDVFTLRRGRLIGEVVLLWTPGPPGQQFVTENLAKKLDAGIQAALPQLQAAVP